MEKLFQEFDEVGIDQWVDQIYKDLKDNPKELLTFQPEFDLNFKSFYHRLEAPKGNFPNARQSNVWKNRRHYAVATNKSLLSDLNQGVDCIGLQFTDQKQFDELVSGIQFEYIDADVQFSSLSAAQAFSGPQNIRLNFDIISQSLLKGQWKHTLSDYYQFYADQRQHQTIWVSAYLYAEAGASCSQELAFAANHANEYIQKLTDEGVSLEEINRNLIIELSVTEDFFSNIAKFKLIGYIVGLVFKAYDENYRLNPITVYARTSARYLALNDANNNLLRQTTMAMSAIIGGCDVITVQTLPTGDEEKDAIMERMAKNIPLILKEESYLDKVADAAEGAYYMEHLCTQMIGNAWDLFKQIEEKGGLMAAAEKGFIQQLIAKNREELVNDVNSKRRTFLGVNKYPSGLEDWQQIPDEEQKEGEDFAALHPARVELKYKK